MTKMSRARVGRRLALALAPGKCSVLVRPLQVAPTLTKTQNSCGDRVLICCTALWRLLAHCDGSLWAHQFGRYRSKADMRSCHAPAGPAPLTPTGH